MALRLPMMGPSLVLDCKRGRDWLACERGNGMMGRVGVIELIPIALMFVMVLGPVPFGLAGAFLAGVQEATASAPVG